MAAVQDHAGVTKDATQPDAASLKLYIIPTEDKEKQRLELQHSVIVRQFGWHLHPTIRVKPTDEVLEVATGTGIWTLELAAMSPPTIKIEACDINPVYFPSPSLVPPNVTFSLQSVLTLPRDWTDRFDVIHQRLLVCGLSAQNWRTALQELYRVTKPGGWIQLIEIDVQGKMANRGPAAKKLFEWLEILVDKSDLVFDAVEHVLEHVQAAGFINDFQERKLFATGTTAREENALQGDLESDTLYCILVYFRVMKSRMLKLGLCSEEEVDEAIEGVKREYEANGMIYEWFVYCGQKPE